MGQGRRKTKERCVKSKFLWSKSSALVCFLPCFKVNFLKLHSQMNPQSHVVPLAKHLSQKRTLNDEPWVACWTGIYKKESIAFAVKTACTVFIGVGVLRGRPWGGGRYCLLFPCRCQQYVEAWICSRLADGPSPVSGQPACQQHSPLPRTQCSVCRAACDALLLCLPSFTACPETDAVFSPHAKAKRAGLPV